MKVAGVIVLLLILGFIGLVFLGSDENRSSVEANPISEGALR